MIEDRSDPVRTSFCDVGFYESAAIKKVVCHYRRSSIIVSEMGLPLIWIGGRLRRARFIGKSDNVVGGQCHNETSRRRTSSLFSGGSPLIASTISSTVDIPNTSF